MRAVQRVPEIARTRITTMSDLSPPSIPIAEDPGYFGQPIVRRAGAGSVSFGPCAQHYSGELRPLGWLGPQRGWGDAATSFDLADGTPCSGAPFRVRLGYDAHDPDDFGRIHGFAAELTIVHLNEAARLLGLRITPLSPYLLENHYIRVRRASEPHRPAIFEACGDLGGYYTRDLRGDGPLTARFEAIDAAQADNLPVVILTWGAERANADGSRAMFRCFLDIAHLREAVALLGLNLIRDDAEG
jgi:hypothetical protein